MEKNMANLKLKKKSLTYLGQPICNNLCISCGENIENNDILMIYEYENIRGSTVNVAVPLSKVRTKKLLSQILLDKGFPFDWKNKEMTDEICEFLSDYTPSSVILLSPQTGWYQSDEGKYCYIMPQKSFGFKYFRVKFVGNNIDTKYINQVGNLENYQKALELCQYSPATILAVGAALAAFCIAPFDFETFGLHFYGKSSTGKSTLSKVAAAVLYNPGKFITWKTTEAGVEEACYNHNGRCVVFDEAKLISKDKTKIASIISDLSYFICSGQTKKRSLAYSVGTGTSVGAWKLVFISTGEFGIIENALSVNHEKDDGEKLRFIDVPAVVSEEYGVFRKLPEGYTSSKELVFDILNLVKKNYGWLGYNFLKKMASKLNSDQQVQFRENFKQHIKFFESECSDGKHVGYTERLLSRFAIIYASLMQAMEWQLIPWSKKCIFKAVKEMYYTSLNCIKDDQDILQDGLNRLEKMLNVKNEHYHNLATFSSQEDILRAWGKPNFFGKQNGKYFDWIIPSKTFVSCFTSTKQKELVEEFLEDLIEKNDDGYGLCSLGHNVRKRAIVLDKDKLKKLLSK